MLKQTLVFTNPFRLSLKNAQLVIVSKEMPEEMRTIPIEDVGMVIIENQMISVSIPLLNELVDAGVAVVLCDRKGMPHAMLQNMDGSRESERIDINKLRNSWIRRINIDIRPVAENIFIFTLCRLYNQERNSVLMQLRQHLINCVTFT